MAVQTTYTTHAPPAKPRAACLTVDVADMDEDRVADLQRRLKTVASELKGELGTGSYNVKAC